MKTLHADHRRLGVFAVLVIGWYSAVRAADSSSVQELRIQRVGDITYFHVRLERPKDLLQDLERNNRGFFSEASPSLTPRFIAPDGQVRLVCERFDLDQRSGIGRPQREELCEVRPVPPESKDKAVADKEGRREPRLPVPVQGLEFVGRTEAKGEVKMKLLYPVQGRRVPVVGRLRRTPPPPVWKELEVVLDFGKAKDVAIPAEANERKKKPSPSQPVADNRIQPPVRDDLEGLWAAAQVDQFIDLDSETHEFGFYGFAAAATARKYGVDSANSRGWLARGRNDRQSRLSESGVIDRELYETTTGAAAITESLQLRRMNGLTPRGDDQRTIPIGKIQGIDVAEHPWEKMIGDKKPAPENFASLVPHDNYYVHFKNIARFLEFSELIDQWGTNLTRAYEATSRDYRLKDRYEQQLCLRSTILGKTLGPLVIKGIGITGSDAYLREGSDVAILFQVVKSDLFLAAVEPFLSNARKQWGQQLKESKSEHRGITIESFVTPLREVSLHRASFDAYVIYANSSVGLRRIIDCYRGESKRLSQMLDFQYMRTVFRYDDGNEDGFAFLSDAFIRNLVGPASKIKERRRLEALVSLHMLTHGAMFTAWDLGRAPVSYPNIINVAGLKLEELPMPDGKAAIWDPEKLVARSDVYNTIHFATPLIELPIDQVTPTEADEYNRFRLEYLGLWRQYFDPIGIRVSLNGERIQLDTYILPLIENSTYNQLRRVTGQKTVRFDPSSISDKTLFQYLIRLTSDWTERESWLGGRVGGEGFNPLAILVWGLDPVGEWFLVRLDDSPVYEKLLALAERSEAGTNIDMEEVVKLVWSIPIAVGIDVRNPLVFGGALAALRSSVKASLPGALTWEPMEKEYKGVSIVRVQATPQGRGMLGPILRERKDGFLPAVYYALIDGGFYMTLNEKMIQNLIDGAAAPREVKGAVDVSSALYLGPKAAEQAQGLLRRLLEYQAHQQSRASLPIWYALYRTGIVATDANPEQAQTSAYRYLGFVPVSPDGSGFTYDRKYDEVVNERHGSFRKPALPSEKAEHSPLNFLLDQVRSIRADLRFREDGIHTVLTIHRSQSQKQRK